MSGNFRIFKMRWGKFSIPKNERLIPNPQESISHSLFYPHDSDIDSRLYFTK